jgi:hypothetical protein
MGCEGVVSAGWGQFQGFCRVVIRHWGLMAARWLTKQRERETLAGFSLGLPSFPSMPTANDKGKRFSPDPFGLREKI